MNEQTLTVNIAERPYRLKVNEEEVDVILRGIKAIEDNIKAYYDNYGIRDRQDLVAMTLLQFATENIRLQTKLENCNVGDGKQVEDIAIELKLIEDKLDKAIQE